ncbi:MAG: hypothetical protein HFG86_02595 [Dorea sp.]|jgi:hypothetical protein|nr:hypothetical protein [Dorea sp.]
MEEEYWQRFLASGKIIDYLYYKGMGICKQIIDGYTQGVSGQTGTNGVCGQIQGFGKYEGRDCGESDYSDGYGACGGAGW